MSVLRNILDIHVKFKHKSRRKKIQSQLIVMLRHPAAETETGTEYEIFFFALQCVRTICASDLRSEQTECEQRPALVMQLHTSR